jgi:hypothetical protein
MLKKHKAFNHKIIIKKAEIRSFLIMKRYKTADIKVIFLLSV